MNNMIQQFLGAWLHPWTTMRTVKEQPDTTSINSAMIYIVIMGVLSGIFTAAMSFAFPPPAIVSGQLPKSTIWLTVLLLPIFYFIGSFLSAGFVWGVVAGFVRGNFSQYKQIYRLMAVPVAFYPISTLLAPIPKVGQWIAIAINIWATIVMIRGIIIVMDTPPVRTWVTFVLIFGFILAFAFVASVTARQQGARQPFGGTSDLSGFGDEDLGLSDQELDKQLDDLVGKTPAKAEQPKK